MTQLCVDRQSLSIGEINVWIARLTDDESTTADFLPLLDDGERARARRFSFQSDRVRFIQTRGIVRRLLANYTHAEGATLRFGRNRYGKPHLVSRANGPNLQFSISHSGDYCLLAVALNHPIGIDVEKVRDFPQCLDIAQNYFTPTEGRTLAALRGTDRRDAFFLFWVCKEATIKGLGVSLAANLGRAEFELDRGKNLRFVEWHGRRSIALGWSILHFSPAPGYVAAVAASHPVRSLLLRNWNGTASIDGVSTAKD